MNDFIKFFNDKKRDFPMHLEINYNKVADWHIYIYKKGCANDFPNSNRYGEDAIICNVQYSDMDLAFAKAQVELKEWLLEHDGGY
jgi:hypothetical protein